MDTMTDEEIALDIGKRLIDLEIKIAVLKATLSEYRNLDGTQIDWTYTVNRALLSPPIVEQSQTRFAELKTAIAEDNSDEPLIRIVHQVVCNS